jgi:hypothetical protein
MQNGVIKLKLQPIDQREKEGERQREREGRRWRRRSRKREMAGRGVRDTHIEREGVREGERERKRKRERERERERERDGWSDQYFPPSKKRFKKYLQEHLHPNCSRILWLNAK